MPIFTESTHFTLDVLGRYTCNTLDEAAGGGFAAGAARPDDRPDARPFDVIVIGGGSFGPILAQHLFESDVTHGRRILVLDAGPITLPEHQQNLPLIGDLPVWETPWDADKSQKFAGLAVTVGGRSMFFGGWSPRLLDAHGLTELPRSEWPQSLVDELTAPRGYFDQAARQLGVTDSNDFIFGDLHRVLRERLAYAVDGGDIPAAVALDDLDLQIDRPDGTNPEDVRQLVLEAPLAVQSRSPRSGAFAYNKFSTVPLIMTAARAAQGEIGGLLNDAWQPGDPLGDDAKKRIMVVPNLRVNRLETSATTGDNVRVTRVFGLQKEIDGSHTPVSIPVHEQAVVVVALATIESARLAMLSFPTLAARPRMGQNLMAHLRSNIVMRIPRTSLPSGLARELQASALFLKGTHDFADGGGRGYFHLQITAAGLNDRTKDDHDELFLKIPDIDGFEHFLEADDDHVVITIRGIGEMAPNNSASQVTLIDAEYFGAQRARAAISPSARDKTLWTAMDDCSNDVARALAAEKNFEIRRPDGTWIPVTAADDLKADDRLPYTFRDDKATPGRRDRLGTTHHEAGTLRFGTGPGDSVTDLNAKIHDVENAYVAGPALFPTIGSPNPMLTGTAFARRLADHLLQTMPQHAPAADPGFKLLFDGRSLTDWKQSRIQNLDGLEAGKDNPGRFIIVDGALESTRGTGLGMIWCSRPMPQDYILRLEWLRWRGHDNSGVLLRFPDPRKPGYRNEAYVPDNFGFEVQIDEYGEPDGLDKHKTGAIYGLDPQTLTIKPALPAGEWNQFEIRVQGHHYAVWLNGDQVTSFTNSNGASRGCLDYPFIGLQSHFASRVAFRNIQFKPL